MSILVYVARLSSGASHLRLSSFRSYRLIQELSAFLQQKLPAAMLMAKDDRVRSI
jgi:hypothetical protein